MTATRSLLLISTAFWFFHDLGGAIYEPMILARTDGSAQVLAGTASAAGIGGVTGAIVLSFWGGGPNRRVTGMLAGFIGAGLCKTVFGLGRVPQIWIPAQFCSSLNFPLLGSSENALWMTQITPEKQGRVFAANALVLQGVSAIAALIAGSLADQLLEPAMISPGPWIKLFGEILGTEPGAGMAMLYSSCALAMTGVGLAGFWLAELKTLDVSPTPTKEMRSPPLALLLILKKYSATR